MSISTALKLSIHQASVIMKYFFITLCALALFTTPLSPSLAQAPEGVGMQTAEDLVGAVQAPGSILLADVNVTDVNVTESLGVLSGTFALQGKLGLQAEIVYGITVVNSVGNIFDSKALGTLATLEQGEIVTIALQYTLPLSLHGDVQVLLVAETSAGLPLGTQIIYTTTSPAQTPNLSCAIAGQFAPPTCTAMVAASYVASYFSESVFAAPVATLTIALEAGVATPLAPNLPPGMYTVLLKNEASGEMVRTGLSVAGTFGEIISAVISADETGLYNLTTVLQARAIPGATLQYVLRDAASGECGGAVLPVSDLIITTAITSTCGMGTLSLSLLSAEGVALDTLTQPFSVAVFGTTVALETPPAVPAVVPSEEQNPTLLLFIVGALIILAVIVVSYLLYRRPKEPVTIASLFFLGFFLLAQVQTVSAATFYNGHYWGFEISHIVITTLSSNKSTYTPGETMTFSTTAWFDHDVSGAGQFITYSLGYRSNNPSLGPTYNTPFIPDTQGAPAFNAVFGAGGGPYLYNGTFYRSASIQFTAPSTPGNHFLAFRAVLSSFACFTCSPYQNSWDISNMNFTVISPPPPAGPCPYVTMEIPQCGITVNTCEIPPQSMPYALNVYGSGTWYCGQCTDGNNNGGPYGRYDNISGLCGLVEVEVSTNNPAASWTITGPISIPLSGNGLNFNYLNQPTGMYTITWGSVTGYNTPPTQSYTYDIGDYHVFSGTYTPIVTTPCSPTGSLYSWNGINWDDFNTPSWSPNSLNGYSMSNQGPSYAGGGPHTLTGSISGVTAMSSGNPNRATLLRCGPPPSPSVNLQFLP